MDPQTLTCSIFHAIVTATQRQQLCFYEVKKRLIEEIEYSMVSRKIIAEQGATDVKVFLEGATNHKRSKTTGLDHACLLSKKPG